MLKGKTVVLGVSGSIAAFKAASLASMLVKAHADVHVIMTANAVNFINPITFEELTGNKCLTDTFDRNFEFKVEHVALAKKADIFVIAPATANVIAKVAHGLADDMLTTTFLAAKCPKLIAPAMNTGMLENPITQENLATCLRFKNKIIYGESGLLACGDVGSGRMAEAEVLFEHIVYEIACEKDLIGKKILVTAGPTRESIDPVRFITNHSSGKMGYAIAKAAALRGAEVTLVSGPVSLEKPLGVTLVSVESAAEMAKEVKERFEECDIIIKAAAVADYTPAVTASEKIKKHDDDFSLELKRTEDILSYLGKNKKPGQILCGFSMETENLLENSKAKLEKKNLDLVCANSIRNEGAGFGVDTNVITLITKDTCLELPLMSKGEVANKILDAIKDMKK